MTDISAIASRIRDRYLSGADMPTAIEIMSYDLARALVALERAELVVSAGYIRAQPATPASPPEPIKDPL